MARMSAPVSRIYPVLVRPQIAGNIGSAVRAAKVMGLGPVRLVRPHADPEADEARSLAAGARPDLDLIESVDSTAEAVRGAVRVIGFSARRRDHRSQPLWLPEAATEALRAAAQGPVALLFGTERTGLENEELDHAQVLARIPTGPDFTSINLAQSVMIAAYEIRRQAGGAMESYDYMPAPAETITGFIEALAKALDRRGFFVSTKRALAIRRLGDLFGRAVPYENEIAMLWGMIKSLDTDPVLDDGRGGSDAPPISREERRRMRRALKEAAGPREAGPDES